ncbi:MAG: T9SS type A sorting domain-containing protein [Bacteroidetes bacterium]|nr:T9SS type A sorting domain-containing protein [Bacteroidota bacterium]
MKHHINFLFLFSFFCLTPGSAQSWAWAKGAGGIGSDAANAVTIDEHGNIYVTGNIAGIANFSGVGAQGKGIFDVFITRYDPQGNVVWVKLAGGDDNDAGTGIKYKGGFLYVTGYFNDTAWFETTMLLSRGDADGFIAKYTTDGNLVWVRQIGGSNSDVSLSVDADNAGNVYIGGSYEYNMMLDTFHLSTTNLYNESFLAKYSSDGNVLWAKSGKGNNANQITGVAFDNDHSVFVTGYFGGNFKIGAGNINSATSSYDIFLAKVDENGNYDWLKSAGSTYEDAAHGICSDANGNAIVVGYFAGTAYFDSHTVTYSDYNDIFVAKYDASGNNLWVRAGRGHQLDIGWGVTTDANGNIFATGMYQDVIDFDGNILHAFDRDIFLVSYSPAGTLRWATTAGGVNTDCGFSVAVSNAGMLVLAGYYSYTGYYGNIHIDNAIVNDIVVAAYNPPTVNSIAQVEDDLKISLFPNPVSANANCLLQISKEEKYQIKIFSISGQLLWEELNPLNNRIKTGELPTGIYLVEVTSISINKILRLVKQ